MTEEPEPKKVPRRVSVEVIENLDEAKVPDKVDTDASKDARKASIIEEPIEKIEVEVLQEVPSKPKEKIIENEPKQAKSAEIAESDVKEVEKPMTVTEDESKPKKKVQKAKSVQKEEAEIIEKEPEKVVEEKKLERQESLKGTVEGENVDEDMEALLRRVKKQRSILEEILTKESEKGSEEGEVFT